MYHKKSNFGILVIFVVIGLLLGSIIGELLALILPDGSVVEMFLTYPILRPELEPTGRSGVPATP